MKLEITPIQSLEDPARGDNHFASNLNLITSVTGIGLWDWNLNTDTITYSSSLERIAGYGANELPNDYQDAQNQLIFPPDRQRVLTIIADCIKGILDEYVMEIRIVCKNGSVKWIQDRGTVAERDAMGQAKRMVGIYYEMNQLKQIKVSMPKSHMMDFTNGITGLGTIDWDVGNGLLRFNQIFQEMCGYTANELPRHLEQLKQFLHLDDVSPLFSGITTLLEENRSYFYQQIRFLGKDGRYLWMRTTARVAEWDARGKPTRIIIGCFDVDKLIRSEQDSKKKLQENLRLGKRLRKEIQTKARDLAETRQTSDAMFDASPNVNIIFDATLCAVDCNPAALELFRYSHKKMLLADLMPMIKRSVLPDAQGSVVDYETQLRETAVNGYCEFDFTLEINNRKNVIHTIMKRIPYHGRFAIVAYHMDITSIKHSQQLLMRQDQLLKAVNRVASLLMESDTDDFAKALCRSIKLLGENLGVSRAYIWKNYYEQESLYALELCEWVAPDTPSANRQGRRITYNEIMPLWRSVIEHSIINGPVRDFDNLRGDFFPGVQSVLLKPIILQGEFWGFLGFEDCMQERVFEENDVRIMHSAGILVAAAVFRNEITENLMIAKDDAVEGSRAKSDFLSRMSHEIRTPMNAIVGMTAIAKKSGNASRMSYCLDRIEAASYQLLGLVNDILDMSKIEAGKLELTPGSFDFEKMIRNVCNVVNVKMIEKNLDFSVEFSDLFLKNIICDELRLSQVLINLLGNAAKFTPKDGSVNLKLSHFTNDNGIGILHAEVKDNGIGISTEQQSRLFQVFEQADVTTTRKYGGSGLGLAICKSITRLMGGDIWIESEEGKGATFVFEVHFKWDTISATEVVLPALHKDLRILVVDDSHFSLMHFQNILDKLTLGCDVAAGGEQALAMVRSAVETNEPYSIIFVDWMMPEMDGIETAHKIRSMTGGTESIVLISTADKEVLENSANALDINYVLPKPIFPSSLYDAIVSLTDNNLHNMTLNPSEEIQVQQWAGKRILLAEDIEINREIIYSVLAETGVEVESAQDGLEATQLFASDTKGYDLILMDMQMPRMDGLAATQRIRLLPGGATVPIVAMTANAFKEDVDRCLKAGMNSHIAKPIDINTLIDTLSPYLEKVSI